MICDFKLTFLNKYFQVFKETNSCIIQGKKHNYTYGSLATWLEKQIFDFIPGLKE